MSDQNLIIYYFHSGNTRRIAELIQQEVGGILIEIEPEVPYPTSYNAVLKKAKKEIKADLQPSLKTKIQNIESYETVYIGSPNWWSTIVPPISTFLSEYDLTDKTIIPFCTHGGGGLGRVVEDIKKLCPESKFLSSIGIYGSGAAGAQAKVSSWLSEIGMN